jgi:hypothetical protein
MTGASRLAIGVGAAWLLYQISRARFITNATFNIISAKIIDYTTIRTTMQVNNPSPYSININSLVFSVNYNNREIASYNSNQLITIKSYGTVLQLDAKINLLNVLAAGIQSIISLRAPLKIFINGFAIIGTIKVPFNQVVNLNPYN